MKGFPMRKMFFVAVAVSAMTMMVACGKKVDAPVPATDTTAVVADTAVADTAAPVTDSGKIVDSVKAVDTTKAATDAVK